MLHAKIKMKLGTWLKRYGPAEVVAIIFAYIAYFIAQSIYQNPIISAYAASLVETFGYYLVIVSVEVYNDHKIAKSKNEFYWKTGFHKSILGLLAEFGIAELLDSFIFRPLAFGLCVHYFGEFIGVFLGKIVGDITFYIPVIFSYELKKFILKKK